MIAFWTEGKRAQLERSGDRDKYLLGAETAGCRRGELALRLLSCAEKQ